MVKECPCYALNQIVEIDNELYQVVSIGVNPDAPYTPYWRVALLDSQNKPTDECNHIILTFAEVRQALKDGLIDVAPNGKIIINQ